MKEILLYQSTFDELVEAITSSVVAELKEIIPQQKTEEFQILTRKETADFFSVSLVTIHEWTKQKIIKSYKLGNRTYYMKSELIKTLLNSSI